MIVYFSFHAKGKVIGSFEHATTDDMDSKWVWISVGKGKVLQLHRKKYYTIIQEIV